MATVKQMLEIAGSLENAELLARKFVKEKGNTFLMDLQIILSLQGKFDEAFDVNNQALEDNPNDVRVKYNRGWFAANKGKMLEGFNLMNEGRMIEVWGNKYIKTEKPIWDGSGDGKHILVNMEAGIGDQIIFARFIKDIEKAGGKPIVCCSSELMPLFARLHSCSAVIEHESYKSVYHDCWVPSMGLPVVMKYEYKDIDGWSYLKSSTMHSHKFKEIIKGDKLKVGIRWSGNPEFEHEQFRKFPEELLFNIVNRDDLDVYGLQNNCESTPDFVTNLSGFLQSWEDTAGAIDNLDLVISSCTAVAHLASAMGIPTWVIVPILPYWAWALPGDKSPWHKSITIFRQKKFNYWNEPFKEIGERLDSYEIESRLW